MTAKEIITGMPAKIRPEVIEGLNTLFHFDISGDEGGQYSVKIADRKRRYASTQVDWNRKSETMVFQAGER